MNVLHKDVKPKKSSRRLSFTQSIVRGGNCDDENMTFGKLQTKDNAHNHDLKRTENLILKRKS